MPNRIVDRFHATAVLERAAVFADRSLEPVTAPQDARTASPGWVGAEWKPGGTLLVGINPGGGGDATRGNPHDARLYGLIRAFRDSQPDTRADGLAAMSRAWIEIQATHNIRRVVDAIYEATGGEARTSAFINVVPFRTRNDAAPRSADLARAWEAASGPQVEALAPGRIVALGRKAYDALARVGADRDYDVVLIKRAIGDSTITPEAREVLAQLMADRTKTLPAPGGREIVQSYGTASARIPPTGGLRSETLDGASLPPKHALADLHGIKSSAARAAHLHLLDVAARMNLIAEPHVSAITAVKLLDRQGRYLFSWIINAHHLLFYLRKPALKIAPGLADGAQRSLTGVKVNPAGEVTVRLETAAGAERLTAWLFDRATWAASPRVDRGRAASRPLPATGGE